MKNKPKNQGERTTQAFNKARRQVWWEENRVLLAVVVSLLIILLFAISL